MPLNIDYANDAKKYLASLDAPTRKRVEEKVRDVAADYLDPKNSKPLTSSEKRSARVGKYRILFLIIKESNVLFVAEIASRGEIYRNT